MFALLKQIFSRKNKDVKQRVFFTLFALFIFKLGTMIQVPGTTSITKDLGFLELMDAMGGGAFKQFSIFALGVTPYISASIVTQLLQMDIIPYFSDLAKQGPSGRMKINKINRYLAIILAFLQGYIFSLAFIPSGSGALEYMRIAVILTAGTAFVLWLSDQITQKGIGNGVSLIIMAGIVMTTPTMFVDAFREMVVTQSAQSLILGIVSFIIFVIVYLAIIIGVIYVQQSERRIPIQYTNKTTSAYGAKQSYMPIKLNSAGVMPVIFASMIVSIPSAIAQFTKNEDMLLFVQKYLNYNTVVGFVLYMLLIIFFAYFYTFMQMKPEEMASNFQKQGGYIPGIRPGKDTASYIKQVLSRLTIIGAIFLMIIAGLPILFSNLSSLSTNVTIGGTGLLIVVGVALETYNQLESILLTRNYGGK
ncbi:MAG TPA: preprotein translocase subunit SecY [Mollicutes bacterium]|nr:preprotein translocase subunit SecY [Mollicutes bacterium]